MAELKEVGEFGLIKMIAPCMHAPEQVIRGIGDDCAVLPFDGQRHQVITCDLLVENVHFVRDQITPYQLGYKSVAVSLSDIAAMGGWPTNILISMGMPPGLTVDDWQEFYRGVADICAKYHVNLIGGDTTASEQWVINVTAMGLVASAAMCLRSDAQVGDLIFVTGALGASRAGLELVLHPTIDLPEDDRTYLLHKHHQPEPCCVEVALLQEVFGQRLHALNDISDGLLSECGEIAEASGVAMVLQETQIPVDNIAQRLGDVMGQEVLQWALSGGEDYQLVGTIAPEEAEHLARVYQELGGQSLRLIGEVTEGTGVFLAHSEQAVRVNNSGFNHFQ